MGRVSTEIVGDAHAYTRSDVPWSISTARSARGKLIDYISGGGMRAFGRTVRQEEIGRRHRRLFAVAIAFAVLWAVFWVF